MRAVILVFCAAAISACGVSDDAVLAELTADEVAEICAGQTTEEVTCGEGDTEYTVDATDEGDCATGVNAIPSDCTATVGNWRTCSSGLPDDICDAEAVTDALDNSDCEALACG